MNANELLIWLRVKKRQERKDRMAFADHVYANSETSTIAEYLNDEAREWEEDNAGIDLDEPADKSEQCVECGKDSWTCEHYREEDNR